MIKIETRVVKDILEEYCQSCNKRMTTIRDIKVGITENYMFLIRLCPECYQELRWLINK